MILTMKFPARKNNSRSAIALIIVMLMVLAMGIAAGILAYSMKVETKLATNTSASGELEWLGLSGVEFAKWVLAEQQRIPGEQGYNGLNQFWAGGPGGNGPAMRRTGRGRVGDGARHRQHARGRRGRAGDQAAHARRGLPRAALRGELPPLVAAFVRAAAG